MAVYTKLEFGEIEALLKPFALGRLIGTQGVAAGVENTTYFIDMASDESGEIIDRYVLTIAETLCHDDLAFIVELMHDLSSRDLPVPEPVQPKDSFAHGDAVLTIRGKPAMLVPRIAGTHPHLVTPELCSQIGSCLAKMHRTALKLGHRHESHRSLNWVSETGNALLPHLPETESALLNTELSELTKFVSTNIQLPTATIHGDLFRDNVIVENGQITAIIDFFSAGTGYLTFDLAVVVNDWCFDEQSILNTQNYDALIGAYCSERSPEKSEIDLWEQILRIAALRFWVSRLNEQIFPAQQMPSGRGKDPAQYRQLTLLHRNHLLPLGR